MTTGSIIKTQITGFIMTHILAALPLKKRTLFQKSSSVKENLAEKSSDYAHMITHTRINLLGKSRLINFSCFLEFWPPVCHLFPFVDTLLSTTLHQDHPAPSFFCDLRLLSLSPPLKSNFLSKISYAPFVSLILLLLWISFYQHMTNNSQQIANSQILLSTKLSQPLCEN